MNTSPLTPQEQAWLQMLTHRAQANGQQIVVGPDMRATLTPPSTERRILAGVPYEETPVAEPVPWLPISTDIAWGLNDRVSTFTNQTINAEATNNLGFDIPSVVYAITAAVRDTAGNSISGAFGNVLDTFRIQFGLTNGRNWQTANTMGSTICGTAERPRFLGRSCWRLNNGAVLQCRVTPLVANLQIDIVLWCVETTGGSNIVPTG